QADMTCARESYSYRFLTELGIGAERIIRTGDSAFWNFEATDNAMAVQAEFARLGASHARGIFAMTIVNWSFPGASEPEGDAARYAAAMAKIADTVWEIHGLQPVIFNQVREDLPMSRRVQNLAKHNIILDEADHEPELLRAMMARSAFFLGTR